MVRPAKAADVRRIRGAGVRFTADEYAAVLAKASASGVSLSEFLRLAALNRPMPRKAAAGPASSTSFVIANELRRVGVNLNQIARLSHMGIEHEGELQPLLADIREILARVHGADDPARRRAGG
jgi:hypothetical protein